MTNETTASQPKSIGDDAQFQALLCGVWCDKTGEAVPALVEYIHKYFRSPAAQASATIQAAPDTNELHFNAQRLRNVAALVGVPADGDDAHVDGVRGALLGLIATKLRLAAPMVAEPVYLVRSSCMDEWEVASEKAYWSFSEENRQIAYLPAAAPMVADPAGVAVPEGFALMPLEPSADLNIGFAYVDAAREDNPDIRWAFSYAGYRAALKAGEKLAATVKAVPREALDSGPFTLEQRMPPKGEEVLIYFAGSNGKMECRIDEWDDLHEDPIGMGGPTICVGEGWVSYYEDNVTHWAPIPAVNFAAPLADKTGGGE